MTQLMDDIFVGRVMSHDVRTVTADTLVENAAQTMLEDDIGSVVVVDEDNHLEGILTSTDFVRIVAERRPKDETAVSAYMTTEVQTATAGDSIRDVADAMLERGFHHMPVVSQEDGVIGIITTTDLTGYISHIGGPNAD